ncbi:MAG: signal recognition particle protein [Bacteroidota bacterium]|nr:signal recognition particle protein [Bacteroidota bacterium]MDP4232690.1 signal recognition particle protein [Bacteroidota bacterium]MDP4243177.1 signal recognition particle protein [Bacteroidota bacterium]MDP4287634.1 signal recognition particle protein [Bacteroidota bacterium]
MFESLSSRFDELYKKIRGQARLSEGNVAEISRDIRRALLDADVNYKVAKKFVDDVQAKALGAEVLRSVNPEQQFIKILYDELVMMMGESTQEIKFSTDFPTVIMICGLQGSGKTTFTAKLGNLLKGKNRKPLLIAADIYRPAAIEQLKLLGAQIDVPVFTIDGEKNAVKIAEQGVRYARENAYETVIIDTAGRLSIDEVMMQEVADIKSRVKPHEILFVCDAMTGQDAVTTAKTFHDKLKFDGIVLTKLDGDARGGAALSIRSVVEEPIKFVSTGEKLDAIETFHPDRMASRILGMGDVVSLVERAEAQVSAEEAAKVEEKLRKNEFTFDDFLVQLQHIKKMGSLKEILGMIPGVNAAALAEANIDEKSFARVEAIVHSMTKEERHWPHILSGPRRARIALGSGTSVQEVNRLVKQFADMQKMMKKLSRGKMSKQVRELAGMKLPE